MEATSETIPTTALLTEIFAQLGTSKDRYVDAYAALRARTLDELEYISETSADIAGSPAEDVERRTMALIALQAVCAVGITRLRTISQLSDGEHLR